MPDTNVGRKRGACLAAAPSPAPGQRPEPGKSPPISSVFSAKALFGTILVPRPPSARLQREMITLSTLIVLARETQLRRHLGNALHVGLTPEQIVELIIHDTWYSGAPAGLNALALCKDVFEARGVAFTPPRVHDTNEDPDSLFERATSFGCSIWEPSRPLGQPPPTEAERAFSRITGEYYWGRHLDASRPRPAQPLSVHDDLPGRAGT